MRTTTWTVLIAAATAVVVGAVTAEGWPGFVVGAVLALALWVILFCGSYARPDAAGTVAPFEYAVAAALGLVLGGAIFLLGDRNAGFWASGFIIAGVLVPSTSSTLRRDG